MIEIVVRREDWDVDRRLAELNLERQKLLEVRDIARSSAGNATRFHPANAAGTFAYQEGTWALRDRHMGEDWELDRAEGVEAIKNDRIGIRIMFCNVDRACDDEHEPKPRSPKGAGAERACVGNLFGKELPKYVPEPEEKDIATFYLMVDENGAAELSRPVVRRRTFCNYVERIYLSDGSDLNVDFLTEDEGDRVDDFVPEVARK